MTYLDSRNTALTLAYENGRFDMGVYLLRAIEAIEGKEKASELMDRVLEWSHENVDPKQNEPCVYDENKKQWLERVREFGGTVISK